MKPKTIFSLGAYDRFNYGDVLFPIISKNFFLSSLPEVNFEAYALTSSNFSQYGGLPTKPIKELSFKGKINDGDIIYFCGGGTLGSNWQSMHANLLGENGNKLFYYLSRILGNELTNEISRYYFGAESKFPWIADSTDFPAKVKIIYNSVGGSELINFPEPQKKLALSKLRNANYLSVRDIFTAEVLLNNSVTNVYTTPDSAVLMSEQYPIESLENKISNNTRQLLKNMKYVCFHSNYKYLIKNINHISEELKTIHKRYGLEIVLLPIGRYVGLDDFKGLKELKNNLNIRCTLMENNLSIWEIMYTIASAKLFIGTSLHGNVTSQAFCVPHIGLSSKQSKLDYYLKTWDIEAQSSCTKANNISEKAEKVLEIPSSVHLENKITLIKATKENFHRISDAILRT